MQLTEAQLNRTDAIATVRQSRNRIARSVWSASSLLPLYDSASKLDALQTLRVALGFFSAPIASLRCLSTCPG